MGAAMNIQKQLLAEHSRRNTDRIIHWIGADAARLKSVMEIFLGNDPLLTQRSAWVVGVMADEHPDLLQPWLSKMMRKTREPGVHDAVRRNVARALQFVEIPPRLLGEVATVCFDELSSPGSPIAVKACAMTVLERVVEREPELGRELRLIIEQQLPYTTAAFHARAREVLAKLPR
jgi:hypothetical protein